MSEADPDAYFLSGDPGSRAERQILLHSLPASVMWKFCTVMDGLSELDWSRFASEVLGDQLTLRLAEKQERRSDFVMNHWGNRNGQLGELMDLLKRLRLLRPLDVIQSYLSSLTPVFSPPPACHQHHLSVAPKTSQATPTVSTCRLRPTENKEGGRKLLPGPAPPPSGMLSELCTPPQNIMTSSSKSIDGIGTRVMSWSFEEVHAGTQGFSPSLQVGEGGFGVVYRAALRNMDCAVKRLKQDLMLDWMQLKETFHTEVDKLSKFRHPNIVDLLGISEGGGSVCLIYSFMENGSLEDQLHNKSGALSWSDRLCIVEGVSSALFFLHSPPESHASLIHGDVKSSNILLDRHMVPKLADFGLARFACGQNTRKSSKRTGFQTASVGKTETVRGTLAYLPDEYIRNGEFGPAMDVYSFGVVLLEVLTGRPALDRKGQQDIFLKDLVEDVAESAAGSCEAEWRKHLDHHLIRAGSADPTGWMKIVTLACTCLKKRRKERPLMSEVYKKLKEMQVLVGGATSSSWRLPHPPVDSSIDDLSCPMSKLGILEDMDVQLQSFNSPFSPALHQTLHSSSSCSFVGPCETDESQGLPQYDLQSHCRSNQTSFRCVPVTAGEQYPVQLKGPSVPTEDQYDCPPLPLNKPGWDATAGLYGVTKSLSSIGSLQSTSPQTSADGGGISEDSRGPEESDELDYLTSNHS